MNLYLREITKLDKDKLLAMKKEIQNDTLEDKFEGLRKLKKINADNYDDFLIELKKIKI